MALSKRMMAVGIPAQQALATNGTLQTGINTGAGTTQATSYFLQADVTTAATVAANTGVVLPNDAVPTDNVLFCNFGANACNIYPPVGGTLHNLSVNTPLSVPVNKSIYCVCIGALTWFYQLSA